MALVSNTITTSNTFAQLAHVVRSAATELNRRQLNSLIANNAAWNSLVLSGNAQIITSNKGLQLDTNKDTQIYSSADDTVIIAANNSTGVQINPNRMVNFKEGFALTTTKSLTLDTDRDTYIVASVDDRIDVYANAALALTIYPNARVAPAANIAVVLLRSVVLDTDKDTSIGATSDDTIDFYANGAARFQIFPAQVRVPSTIDFKATQKVLIDTDSDTFLTANSVDDQILIQSNNQIAMKINPNKSIDSYGVRRFRGQNLILDSDLDTYINTSTDDRIKLYSNNVLNNQIFPNGILGANVAIRTPTLSSGPLGRRNLFYNSNFDLWVDYPGGVLGANHSTATWATGPCGWHTKSDGAGECAFAQYELARGSAGTIKDSPYAIFVFTGDAGGLHGTESRIRTYVPGGEALCNKKITISYYANSALSTTLGVSVYRGEKTAAGTEPTYTVIYRNKNSINRTFQRYSHTIDIPTNTSNVALQYLIVDFWFAAGNDFATYADSGVPFLNNQFLFKYPQLEIGSFTTEYQPTYATLNFLKRTIVTSASGTHHNFDARTRAFEVHVQGAGGGGGGADGQGASTAAVAGGGGGGGCAVKIYHGVHPMSYLSYTVGTGGSAGAAAGGNGGAGNQSSASYKDIITATEFVNPIGLGGAGGLGATGTAGNLLTSGGSGVGGSGGNWYVIGGDGQSGLAVGGERSGGTQGGGSYFGRSESGQGPSNLAGADGGWYGRGGEGATSINQTTNLAGGAGYQGVIIVDEFGEP